MRVVAENCAFVIRLVLVKKERKLLSLGLGDCAAWLAQLHIHI